MMEVKNFIEYLWKSKYKAEKIKKKRKVVSIDVTDIVNYAVTKVK